MHNHETRDEMCESCRWTDTVENTWDSDDAFTKLNEIAMSESLCTELAMSIITLEVASKGMGLEAPTCANQFIQIIAMIREQAKQLGSGPFQKPTP